MLQWEYCEIEETAVSSPIIGKPELCFQALLYIPQGTSLLMQSETWREGDRSRRQRSLVSLIAKLGLEGWELLHTRDMWVEWFFKRPKT